MIECLIADWGDGVRNLHRRQAAAAIECTFADWGIGVAVSAHSALAAVGEDSCWELADETRRDISPAVHHIVLTQARHVDETVAVAIVLGLSVFEMQEQTCGESVGVGDAETWASAIGGTHRHFAQIVCYERWVGDFMVCGFVDIVLGRWGKPGMSISRVAIAFSVIIETYCLKFPVAKLLNIF